MNTSGSVPKKEPATNRPPIGAAVKLAFLVLLCFFETVYHGTRRKRDQPCITDGYKVLSLFCSASLRPCITDSKETRPSVYHGWVQGAFLVLFCSASSRPCITDSKETRPAVYHGWVQETKKIWISITDPLSIKTANT